MTGQGAKPAEAGDPFEIVGVVLDRPMDDEAVADMARTFVEEYALMGWPPPAILRLFRQPFFAGAHGALERLGEDRVVALIEEIAGAVEDPSHA